MTIATNNDQVLFTPGVLIIDGTRVGDVRVYEDDVMQTVIKRWGTGGGNVPYVYPIQGTVIGFSHTQGLSAQPSEEAFPTLRTEGGGMAVSYDEYNDSLGGDIHQLLRAGTKQSTGAIVGSIVRRLTPTECERLQGFPDGWTDNQADSSRYKQMGNAVTVNVIEWIGVRL